MSEKLETTNPDITIDSFECSEKYHLLAYEKGKGRIGQAEFSMNGEYQALITNLWKNYLEKGQRPQLLDQTLTDAALTRETLHAIAADGLIHVNISSFPLSQQSEELLYWLKSKMPNIAERIGVGETDWLNMGLENIIRRDIETKQKMAATATR